MSVSAAEAERRVDAVVRALHARGLKITHQRLEVVRQIAATDEHPDVETIYRQVRRRVPTISLDTVYRALATLADLGLIAQVTATAGPARYDANTTHHHHFVCTRCGLVRDIVDADLDAVRAPARTVDLGTVEVVEVHLRGVCRSCERASLAGRTTRRRSTRRGSADRSQPTKDSKGEVE